MITEKRKEYHKKWVKEHRDQINANRRKNYKINSIVREKELERCKNWRKKNPEKLEKCQKNWRENNTRINEIKSYRKRNPKKIRAQRLAQYLVPFPKGQICVKCNDKTATLRHHEDYSKPLSIKFLCYGCHHEIHN